MQTLRLSPGEKQFNCEMLNRHMRMDGREYLQQRDFEIEMDPLPLSPASCRVIWGNGYGNTTEVVVSVSTEVATNEHAKYDLTVKALPGSFGPSVESTEICQVIKSTLEHFIDNSEALEPEQFILFSSPYSWKLFIDVLVIKASGAFYEAAMLGIQKSLEELTFPELIVTPGDNPNELHFDIDESKTPKRIIQHEKIPQVYSFAAFNDSLLIDPTPSEITSVQSLLVVGISKDGAMLGLTHFGEAGLRESILSTLPNVIKEVLEKKTA